MYEYKLQIGCLIVVLYFIISYTRATSRASLKCNGVFDVLLGIAPWAIIFDGITAWTVNHMDVVPYIWNLIFHCLFFLFMDLVNIVTYVYVVKQTVGIQSKGMLTLIQIPGILSLVGIIAFMKDTYYIAGATTNYSMGPSVYICYGSLLLHSFIILLIIIAHKRALEKAKLFSIVGFQLLILAVLAVQSFIPESLVSAIFPMLAVIGIYVNFEDPSIRKLRHYNSEMVADFATLVENRDNSTGGHIRRTRGYVAIIIDEMKKHPSYKRELSADYIRSIIKVAPLHDIGKIATPDSILQKPGKLTDEEFEIMKEHAPRGGEIIRETFSSLDSPEYQQIAYEVARHHHEKWNGKGYPDGLKGEEIPLHARIMAIADVFDAVSAKRCYRDAMPLEKCFEIIKEGSGKDFDPKLVDIFFEAKEDIVAFYNDEQIIQKETNNAKGP